MSVPMHDLFAAAFEHSPNAYMIIDRELRYVAANQTYCRLTATPRDVLLGKHIFELFPNDPADPNNHNAVLLRRSFERVLATGEVDVLASLEYRVPERAGTEATERVWSATHTPLRDESGRVSHVLQHTVDVSELTRGTSNASMESGVLHRAKSVSEVNNLLRVEREQLRNLFEQAPGFVAVLRGPEHVFDIANRAYLDVVGRDGLIGKTVRQALPDLEGQGFYELLDRTFATGVPYVSRDTKIVLQRRGKPEELYLDFIYQPITEDGRVVGIFVMGTDVSEERVLQRDRARLLDETVSLAKREERARAEAAVTANESRFMADLAPVQLWTTGPDGTLRSVNRRVLEYLGTTAEALLGKPDWSQWVHPDDAERSQERFQHSLRTGEIFDTELRLRNADHSWRWHLARAAPMRGDDGSISKWFGHYVDVDKLKRVQEEHERLIGELELKNRELDRFAYVASHDLKAPLRGIANIAQWVIEDLGTTLPAPVQENLKHLGARVQRMQQLIDGVLTYSRSLENQGDVRVIEPASLLNEVLSLVSPPPDTTVELVEPFPPFRAPRLLMLQVFLNLLGNAFKHAPGGTIRVSGSLREGVMRIDVSDEGPGVAPEHHARIWELFQTLRTDPASTGIGLSIVRRIVESLGGKVGVDSKEGEGARFFFTLPQD